MNKYFDIFKSYLIEEKKASENTIESYNRDISQFISYCALSKVNDISVINKDFLNKYLEYLSVIGKSDATKSRIIASLRCFFKCLISKGFTSSNPVDGIKINKAPKKLPGILDSNEVVLLLAQPSAGDYKSVRDKAMLELLYAQV